MRGNGFLLFSQEAGPALSMLLGLAIGSEASTVTLSGSSFQAVQLQTTVLLDQNWEKL